MAITQEAVPHTHGEQLKKRSLGVPSLVFLIIAASAPLTVLADGVRRGGQDGHGRGGDRGSVRGIGRV